MIETVTSRGVEQLEAEQLVRDALEDETVVERQEREQREAAAERRRQYEQQQAFIAGSPVGILPGVGMKVRSGKGKQG